MGTAQTWNSTYENNPTDGSSPANGDDELRNIKTTIRGINNKEHWHGFETGVDDTNTVAVQGLHRAGSAMPFIGSVEPTTRVDGTSFDYEHDYGRLWIDTGNGGKLMYLYFEDEDDLTPEWKPSINYSIGEIAAFAFTPDDADRWLPCDGRQITAVEVAVDGTTGGYEALVTALRAEAAGDTDHPYLRDGAADTAYVPDLRGVSLRGLDDLTGAGSLLGAASRDVAGRVNTEALDVDVANTVAGSYQADKIYDHVHKMDHTHGGITLNGYDSDNGRTGVPAWNSGNPFPAGQDGDETGNWNGDDGTRDDALTANGILTTQNPHDTTPKGGSTNSAADDAWSTIDLAHYHTIPRNYGLTRNISDSNAAADPEHGVPEVDQPYADEGTVKNVAVYYFIRY